jgi:hypothetical protein
MSSPRGFVAGGMGEIGIDVAGDIGRLGEEGVDLCGGD